MQPNVDSLIDEIRQEFPRLRLRPKSSNVVMRALGHVLGKPFMNSFLTTVGNTIYTHSAWDTWPEYEKCAVLRHERVHMRQARKLTMPIFWLVYAFFPVPILFAWGRMRLEREAYEENIKADIDYDRQLTQSNKDRIVGFFTGPSYGWMWVLKGQMERWYDRTLKRLTTNG